VPTYSYRCTECGTAFDIHQAFSDATLTVCPTCGGALRKIFSPVGVSFTGSGFYRNDSRAKPAGEKGASEKSSPERVGTEKTGAEKKPEKAAASKEKAASTPSTSGGTGKAAASNAAS
jgi:putative FmdB family regulatory protein